MWPLGPGSPLRCGRDDDVAQMETAASGGKRPLWWSLAETKHPLIFQSFFEPSVTVEIDRCSSQSATSEGFSAGQGPPCVAADKLSMKAVKGWSSWAMDSTRRYNASARNCILLAWPSDALWLPVWGCV